MVSKLPFSLPFQKKLTIVALTPRGRQKIEASNVESPMTKICWHLKDHGNSSVSEISVGTGIAPSKVKSICNQLESAEWRWVEWV